MAWKFFKHGDKWRYRNMRETEVKEVDTFALEQILGVIGGPLVSVYRKQPDSGVYFRIDIEEGFIKNAFLGPLGDLRKGEGLAVKEFVIDHLH